MKREALSEIRIEEPDRKQYLRCKAEWDALSKPIDGLGDFEELVCKIAAIRGSIDPVIEKRAVVILCADNGIVEEGISQSGKDITLAVARALGKGISSACSIAGTVGADVIPVDIGMDAEEIIAGVRDCKVARGTANFKKMPAMTEAETLCAIETGIRLAEDLAKEGYDILATGEMGIGNTTTSAAVLSVLLQEDSDRLVGRGAGLDDQRLRKKRQVVKDAIRKYGFLGQDADPLTVLRTLGGLDIAGLTGVFIGAAVCRIPVIIDGVISACAAVTAERLVTGCREYMLASHKGREKGTELALAELGIRPLLNGNLALGEGTGALMLLPLLDIAIAYYKKGAKFKDYQIESYRRF